MSVTEKMSTEAPAVSEQLAPAKWPPAGRLLFRFVFVYLSIYLFFVSGFVISPIFGLIAPTFHFPVLLIQFLLGDRQVNYFHLSFLVIVAGVAAFVWSAIDRKRLEYTRLSAWLRFAVRIVLGLTMISYGADKAIPLQFINGLTPDVLIQPVGNLSPMGMLWAFMATSTPYTIFAGTAEVVGGLLLITERTTLLGALICAGALSNVVMLNFGYDVIVKTFSTHLLLLSLVLIAPDVKRLLSFFLEGTTWPPSPRSPIANPALMRKAQIVVSIIFVAYAVLILSTTGILYSSYARKARLAEPYGLWAVTDFKADGQEDMSPDGTPKPWRWIIINANKRGAIAGLSGQMSYYIQSIDRANNKIYFDDSHGTLISFEYTQPHAGEMTLHGAFSGHIIDVALQHEDTSRFPLTHGGFHWTSDYTAN